MKKYSIIIPHYNSSVLCDILLKSIPERDDIEILVIDDRSKMEEYERLKSYVKKYSNAKLLKNETQGKGAGCARNIGLKHATGKWLIFADSDDFFLEGAFNIIDESFEDEADIVFFLVDSIFLDTQKKARRHERHNEVVLNFVNNKKNSEKWLKLIYSPCGKMLNREFVEKNKIRFQEVPAANDAYFSVKSNFLASKIKVIPQKIYCITQSCGSITTVISEKNFDSLFNQKIMIDKFLRQIKEEKFRPSFFKQIILSRKFGLKKVLSTLKIIKSENLEIFNQDLFIKLKPKRLIKYIKRRIGQKKYEVKY